MASDLAVSVKGVYKKYGRGKNAEHVLKGLNMEVPYHTIFGLLGASGCGKTTLLRCILSSLDPEYGEITVLGIEPGTRSSHIPGRDVGYMPQDVGLIVEFSTLELMMFYGALHRMSLKKIREKMHYLVELLEIPTLYQRIATMSGGQQRRVSFAVALLQDPSLLILDEPTVGLDPLLRVKIWRHLADLTASHQATVIITTHYIEEAKMAHTVGLMRGGVLLAQASPTALLKAYNTTSLESVFLKLAYDSTQNDPDAALNESNVVTSDQQPRIKRKRRLLNYQEIQFPKPTNVLALSVKNLYKICKSYTQVALLVIVPAILVVFTSVTVGSDMRDVKLRYTNDDHSICNNTSFSQFYLENLNRDVFDLDQIPSYSSGIDKVQDGDAWAALWFQNNYTCDVIERYQRICSDILKNANTTPPGLIQNTTILLSLDATDILLSQLSEIELYGVANEGLLRYISRKMTESDALYYINTNIDLTEYVYGNEDFTFRDFFAPGTAAQTAFQSAIIASATSLILEREEGMLDRTYVAGVTKVELILSELLLYSITGIVQVIVILIIVFAIFNVQMQGNIALAGFIFWLISLSGLTVGLVVSALANSLLDVVFAAFLLCRIPSYLAGVVWPLEGLPRHFEWISDLMPLKYAVIAVKAVVSKGMGIDDRQVYEGIFITSAWLIFYLVLAVLVFRR